MCLVVNVFVNNNLLILLKIYLFDDILDKIKYIYLIKIKECFVEYLIFNNLYVC